MKRRILALALACALSLSGCTALLERSYGGVEPYADRYWDSGVEDTLRVETYQDLVNSLLMLIEQRADTGVIHCYGEAGSYSQVRAAVGEVRQETMLGAYLLESLRFTYENNTAGGYGTFSCELAYREDAEDVETMMILSDSQSLVDLLRLAVREGHDQLTARFSYDMPRYVVTAAVQSLWQELCQDELDRQSPPAAGGETGPEETEPPEDGTEDGKTENQSENQPEEEPSAESGEASAPDSEEPDGGGDAAAAQEPSPPEYPPCPWTVRFYPDMDTAELVEILLKT